MNTAQYFKRGALLAGLSAVPSLFWAQSQQPNIIMFMVDDMGWQDTSVPFHSQATSLNSRFKTPNMERLAQRGVKFTEAYACPISSPSRCSLMSGMNTARHRVTNWTLEYNTQTDAGSNVISLPGWNYNGIQPVATATEHDKNHGTLITPLPQILKDNGYYTIHCGKAHFGARTTSGADPKNMGFDVNIAGGANGGPASYLGKDNFGKGQAMEVLGLEKYHGQDIFLTEALTLEAMDAMKKPIAENKPFYLYMSHYAVHAPYHDDARFSGNYRGKYDAQIMASLNENEARYAALVEGMDKSLGDIMNFLDTIQDGGKVAQNTVILFMSDNGGQALNNVRQGRANRDQNYPARAGKGSAFLGGVREPMMVYWPGVTQANTSVNQRVMIEDFFPSILEMAGISNYDTYQHIDGRSFAGVLRDPQQSYHRPIIWHFPNLWGESQDKEEGYGATSSILKDNYHLIYTWETQKVRLYDISTDISEMNDLASALPEKAKELARELTDSLKACNAQRPSYKADGSLIPYPDEAVSVGEPVSIEGKFKLSTDSEKYYYLISDRHDQSASVGGSYYWTIGSHYNQNTIQVNAGVLKGDDIHKQLFYFVPGSDDKHFKMLTYDGDSINYIPGKTATNWNNGNPDNASSTTTASFLQYGTEEAGDFVLLKAGNLGYYGVGYGESIAMNNRGTANGSAGVANMKWIVNDYGNGRKAVENDNGSQYRFTLYDPNQFSTYYREGLITDIAQLNDGDFIVLQNVNTSDAARHGYVYAAADGLHTNLTGAYQTSLSFMKETFGAAYVFQVGKKDNNITLYSVGGAGYIPNSTNISAAYVPSAAATNSTFSISPMTAPQHSWAIRSTSNGVYMNANVGTPVGWSDPHAYNIYKVSKEEIATSAPWHYLATFGMNTANAARAQRRMQLGSDDNASKLVMAPNAVTNLTSQLWQLRESPDMADQYALVNCTNPQGSTISSPSGEQTSAIYTYKDSGKDYGFVVEKTNSAAQKYAGMDRFKIRRKNTSGWWVNAAASGKNFVVNEWSGPEDNGAESGVWSAVIAASLTKNNGNKATGSFCAPYSVELPQGVTAYVATDENDSQVFLTSLSGKVLPANTPVVLVSDQEGYYPMQQTTASADIKVTTNLLKGAGVAPLVAPLQAISAQGSTMAPVTSTIPAFTAYMAGSQAKTLVYDGESAIDEVMIDAIANPSAPIYDLFGRKVKNPSPGIYIQNGKKFIVK